MLVAASVLGACGQVEEGLEQEETVMEEEQALTGVLLGMAAGNIHTGVNQPLATHSEQAMCELANLGAKWLRLDADVATTDVATYRRIVQKAHAKQIKVLVTVPAKYCGEDTDQAAIDAFTSAYVSHLNDLATNTFTGAEKADAYEIGSDPNITENNCADGVSRYRVGPNAFAWLQRRVWEWKQTNARTELIVSGGIHNVYVASTPAATTDVFWNGFFASQAFVSGTSRIRPFDYLGVQPYNNNNMDYTCINNGYTTCFTPWKNAVKTGLMAAASRANTATGTTDTKLFATEFGFQVSPSNLCVGIENCTLTNSLPTGSAPYQQLAAGMNAAGEALVASGVTPVAIWTGYRDESPDLFGLRGVWDAQLNKYRVKTAGWNKYRTMTGSTASTNPEACWIPGTYYGGGLGGDPGNFDGQDALRTTSSNDWAYGYYKGVCGPGERIMGLSKLKTGLGNARVRLCYKDPLDSSRYQHPVPETNPPPTTPDAPRCTARDVQAGDDRGASQNLQPTTSQNWDSGNWRAECAPNEYVAGMAQSLDRKFSHVLCCPQTLPLPQQGQQRSCEVVVFGSADNRQSTESTEWDSSGFKGECGVGRYAAGVSRTPAGQPNALLCCAQ
jgi:hypothetical protein